MTIAARAKPGKGCISAGGGLAGGRASGLAGSVWEGGVAPGAGTGKYRAAHYSGAVGPG
jgi:hypothetical protein